MQSVLALALVVAGCGKGDEPRELPPGPSADRVEGALALAGVPQTLNVCLPAHATHTFVEVIASEGKLRFEDGKLYWTFDRNGTARGTELTCEKLDRSWGGGVRSNGTAYWRGTLSFRCRLECTSNDPGCDRRKYRAATVAGDLKLDCGGITAQERAELDANRQGLLDEQGSAKPPN